MEESQVKLDSNCSGSIGENNVEVQKKKEETFRSGIHSCVHGRVCECVCACYGPIEPFLNEPTT